MRSALLSVKGVKRAKVTFETGEAVVTYDPAVAKVEDMLQAVANAVGISSYSARVKETAKP